MLIAKKWTTESFSITIIYIPFRFCGLTPFRTSEQYSECIKLIRIKLKFILFLELYYVSMVKFNQNENIILEI